VFFGKKEKTKKKRERMEVTMSEGVKRKNEEKVQERMRHEEKEWVEEKTRRHELVRGKEQELVWGRGGGG
jgi:hypothetical protein